MLRFCFPAVLPFLLAAQPAEAPKLVVGIVIDQFRYDYLTRFRGDFSGGIARLLDQGAVFTNANYEHVPTVTAIGHSTFLTGATPAMSGIVGNEWWDRDTRKRVMSIDDGDMQRLGVPGAGASPRRLLQSTVGDELKMSGKGGKVIGISLKDRSAILPAGHTADGAYWIDTDTGTFVSSTYYFPALPAWVAEFNQRRIADRYLGVKWISLADSSKVFRTMSSTPDKEFYKSFEKAPYGNEMVEEFAERAIEIEKLGQGSRTDLLTLSFSSNDYLGHDLGPDSEEMRDITLRTDRLLAKFFAFLDQRVGLARTLVVFTADHGVPPLPEVNTARKMPGGRIANKELAEPVEAALAAEFGPGRWILHNYDGALTFDTALIREKKLSEARVEEVAARTAAALPHVFRVYTRTQLLHGLGPQDRVDARVRNGFHPARSGHVIILLDPYWFVIGTTGRTSHMSPFSYDAHVPVIFLGPGIRPGRYHRNVAVNDIAPTLATLLQIETPSGSVGRVLDEALATR